MIKITATFNLNIADNNDKITREDLILKAKEIYESLKHISLMVKTEKLHFRSKIQSSDKKIINEECFVSEKADEYKKIILCGLLIDGFIKSIEEKTGKIEIGKQWYCD